MPLIQVRGLTKLYRMGDTIVRALDGVDLDIEAGEFLAITGPSGSGKSTMMHLLGCLDRPTAGTYLLAGRNVSEMSDRELARVRNRSIGFVFQTFNLLNRTTALENVAVPLFYARRANTRGPSRRALERVGLSERALHTPVELSGGERQRVAIARAIVNDPLLVLADEPTGNLDSRTGQQIMEIFRALNEQGVTIVLVTHEHDVAVQAKRIVQMRDGKIVLDRPVAAPGVGSGDLPAAGGPPDMPAAGAAQRAAVVVGSAAQGREPAAVHLLPAALPRRLAAGANGALACGIAGPLLLLATGLVGFVVGRMGPQQFGPHRPPPPVLIVLTLVTALCFLLALIAGFAGIFWGRAVRRRIRTVPGVWGGEGRARAAWICGLLTVLVPVVLICVRIVAHVVKLPGA